MASLRAPLKSEVKPFVAGTPIDFSEWVNLQTNGNRVVIDRLLLRIVGTITVATAAYSGYDVPRLVQQITVLENGGVMRWSLSGLKSRAMSMELIGEDQYIDHGNIVVGAAQAVDLTMIIPFEKRFVVRGRDYSMGADLLQKISINAAQLASAQSGTTVLSAPNLSCYMLAEWHEEEEGLELKMQDQCTSMDFITQNEARLVASGLVHNLFIMKEGTASGGDSVAAITDARCDDLNIPILLKNDFLAVHRIKRKLGTTGSSAPGAEQRYSLAGAGMILPLVSSDEDTSCYDGRLVKNIKVNTSGAPAGCSLVYRVVLPRDQQSTNIVLSTFEVSDAQLLAARMKTAAKSMRDKGDWSAERKRFMPMSIQLPTKRNRR